jgi:hypothetical protein
LNGLNNYVGLECEMKVLEKTIIALLFTFDW